MSAHLNSPFVDPEFAGFITLELRNCGSSPLVIHKGMPVAKLFFARLAAPSLSVARAHYGRPGELASRYADEFG
jgi:deoxycytidine triphosphate deaminase